ncbi:hypothetical protein JYT74_01015 [Crocinitomix catalasitica]|nr:hypothetical protein [Crocinitomix catalasitica]
MFKRTIILLFILLPISLIGQIPEHIHVDNDEPDWTNPINIVVLIVVPIFLVVFSMIWRARLRAKAAEEID